MEESTKKLLIVAISIIAVLGIVACVACAGFGSTSDPLTSTDGTTNPTYTNPSSSEPATYRVGEVISVNSYSPVQFSVQEVIRGNSAWSIIKNANMFNDEPDTGYEYIMYKVWIKNTDSEKKSVSSYEFPIYGNGVEGEYAFVVLPDNYHELNSISLLPGGETSGWIVSEIPANADCMVAYEDILGSVYAYVKL